VKSLYAKLALVLLALFCVVTGLYLALSVYTTRNYNDEVTQKHNRTLAATIVRQKPMIRDGRIEWHMLEQIFDALMAVNPNIEIYLLDRDGKILAFSAPKGEVKRTHVSLAPIRSFLRGDRLPIRGDDPRDSSRAKIFSVAPVPPDSYLYVILGGGGGVPLQRSWILQQSAAIAVAGLVFAFAAGLLLFNSMTRRLRRLASEVEAFRTNESGSSAAALQTDEVTRLDASFHEMAERIALQDKELKELIANVSHDLRTPLASLRGYLDTLILKEGQLSPEEQRRFVEIASKHSERLGRLVDELFELAKLESKAAPLRVEAFSMAELVQDVVLKFQLRAEQAGIRLAAEFRPDLPLVSGDIAMMERVLENLIENAIRYTPAGGNVTVSLVPDKDKLLVRVTDTGVGIAEESLPFIFDRFWRGDESARRGGAGLGLAIAKRILELHGTELVAQSRVNAGTTFTFAV